MRDVSVFGTPWGSVPWVCYGRPFVVEGEKILKCWSSNNSEQRPLPFFPDPFVCFILREQNKSVPIRPIPSTGTKAHHGPSFILQHRHELRDCARRLQLWVWECCLCHQHWPARLLRILQARSHQFLYVMSASFLAR